MPTKELTTQEAADFLNVSHSYLNRLIESGEIPYRQAGIQRRICCQQLMDYKQKIDEHRKRVLDELTAQAQELNMGYE